MATHGIDPTPPPSYTLVSNDAFAPSPQTASSARDLDDHLRGLNIAATPGSYPPSSPTTGRVSNDPRYLYYQIFSPDGIMDSKRSFGEEGPHTGRVIASHIAPPRTVASIKRFLCKAEEISDIDHVDLLAYALTSESKLKDEDCLQILSPDGPGSLADAPMALVISPVSGPSQPLKSLTPPFSLFPLHQYHKTVVRAVVFSPDGTKIVSGAWGGMLCIWNVTTGRLATSFHMRSHVWTLSLSPDDKHIIAGCDQAPYIQMYDTQTETPVTLPFNGHTHSVHSIAFSPDGRQIASGSFDQSVRIWDARLGTDLIGSISHATSVESVAFSPDGCCVASGDSDGTVHVWNTTTRQLVAGPFQGHSKLVRSLAFCPDGRWLVSGSIDNDVRVWDIENGRGINSASRCLVGHSDWVTSIAFGPGAKYIASGSFDGTVRIWSFETSQHLSTLSLTHWQGQVCDGQKISTIAISPKGDCIVAGTRNGGIYMWKRERENWL